MQAQDMIQLYIGNLQHEMATVEQCISAAHALLYCSAVHLRFSAQ
jgi:hypothetical protein